MSRRYPDTFRLGPEEGNAELVEADLSGFEAKPRVAVLGNTILVIHGHCPCAVCNHIDMRATPGNKYDNCEFRECDCCSEICDEAVQESD